MTSKLKDMLSRVSAQSLKPTLAPLAASLVMAIGGSAWGDITWTGAGDDSNWETTGNWSAYDTTTGMLLDHSSVSGAYEIDISSNPQREAYIWIAANDGVTLKASGTYGLYQTGGDIRVGTWANGTLTIDGGTHIINSLVVASGWWSNFAPVGVMTIKGGATVTAGWNALGDTDSNTTTATHNPASSGTLNVENASLALTSDLLVGRLAVGTLNVNDGGVVSCQGADNSARWTILGESATGNGTINLNAGGTLAVWHIQKGSGSAAINFNGGTLKTLGNTGNCEYILGNDGAPATGPAVSIGAKGAVFDSNGLDTKVGVAVTGVGTITKKGTGTLTFSGDMSGFIGKVAVANEAGAVTLPASAERARAGDYTSKTENQDGTFTFSYDSSSAPAATQYATLLNLDFEDSETYSSGWTGKTITSACIGSDVNNGAAAALSQGTRANGSKYLNMEMAKSAYRGAVYETPSSSRVEGEYILEFDWFALAGYADTKNNPSGFALYDTSGNEIVGVNVPCGTSGTATVYRGAKEASLGTISAGRAANPATNTTLWHHVTVVGSANNNSLILTIVDGDGVVKISGASLGDFVNIARIYVCIGNRSEYSISGGIDNVVVTTPAVAGVDGVNYATFTDAVAAATSSSTITLYSDVKLTSSVTLPYGATLDLNGYALYTTDDNVAVTFNDGVHCLAATTAGGYKTFSDEEAYLDTVYVWVGENGGAWATSTNWQLAGVTTHGTLPAYNSIVLIPGGDGTEMVIKCPGNYAENAYTGYLSIERDVRLQPSDARATNQGIHLTKVSGTGTLILEGWTKENNGYYYLNIYAGDSSISKMEVDCDLCVKGYVYFPNSGSGNNKWSKALQLNGSLSGDGSIAFNAQADQPGFLFYGDTTKFEGSYYGGGRNSWNRDGTRFVGASSIGSELAYWKFGVEQNSSSADIGWPLNVAGEYEFGRLDAPCFRAHASDITVKVGNLAGTSTITGKLEYAANKIVKVGASSTLDLTLTESVGAVEAEAGTLNLKGTVAPASLTITGAAATVTVEDGNPAVPVLADSLENDYTIVQTEGEGFTTYKAGANCTITWQVEGLDDEVVPSAVGAVVSHADAVRDGYVFDHWEPAVVSPATGNATYTAIWKTAEVSVSKPVVEYGADYTRATVTAAVEVTTPGDVTYELTVTKGATTATYTGKVSGGTVTFADVEVPRDAADIYADITYTVTPKAGTTALTSAATTEAPTTKSAWAFSSTVNSNAVANVGGSWTAGAPTVAEGRLSVTDATFTPTTNSVDDIVVITMEGVIFGDINDAEISDAQAGIRIGTNDTFEVLSETGWIETEILANGEDAYDVVLTINYATKEYSVKIGTGTKDDIKLAGSETGVNAIEFNGAGSLASLAGEAYDGNMVVDKDGNKYATVAAAIEAYVANNSIAPLTMLHPGTPPACWTIDENGVLAQAGIVVEEEETAATEETKIVAVPYSTTTLTAATLINMSNRTEVNETLVLKVYDKTAKDYNSWTYKDGEWVANNVAKADAVSEEIKTSKPATEVQLETGDGVWVTYNPQTPLILNGTYATAGSVQKTLEVGYNLIAPPPTGAATYSVRSITSATAGDKVVIPAGTGKPPRSLTRKGEKWGYWGVQDGQPVWVDVSEEADVTVPAGTGFWYISTSGDAVTL